MNCFYREIQLIVMSISFRIKLAKIRLIWQRLKKQHGIGFTTKLNCSILAMDNITNRHDFNILLVDVY